MSSSSSFRRACVAIALLFGVVAHASAACVTGSSGETQVQAILDLYAEPNVLSAADSCVADGSDGLWRATQPLAQADLRFEFAGYAPKNAFGIYDPYGQATLEIFSGSDAADTSRLLSITPGSGGITFGVLQNASLIRSAVFTSNVFGFYLTSPDGLFRSESSANADGDHLVAFRLPYFADRFLLGWEDLLLTDSDGDFNDMGIVVTNVAPVPLPAAAWLLLSGLAGVATFARRRARAGPAA